MEDMDRIVVFDLEVENHPYYGVSASPVHPDNYVVASAWATLDGEVQSVYRRSKDDTQDWARFLDLATPGGMLVAHNAPFDVQWLLVQSPPRMRGSTLPPPRMRGLTGEDYLCLPC